MSAASDLVDRWYHAFDVDRDAAACVALVAADCELVAPGARLKGPDEIRAYLQAFLDASQDLHHEIQGRIAEDHACLVELVAPGTHTGPLATAAGPLPASGRRMEIHAANVFRVRDGRFSSIHFYFDPGALETQLGIPRGTLAP